MHIEHGEIYRIVYEVLPDGVESLPSDKLHHIMVIGETVLTATPATQLGASNGHYLVHKGKAVAIPWN